MNGRFTVELHDSPSSATPIQTVADVAVDSRAPQVFTTLNSFGPTTLTKTGTPEVYAKAFDVEPYYWVTGAYTTSNVSSTSVVLNIDGIPVSVAYDFNPADRTGSKKLSYTPTAGANPADPFAGGLTNGTHYVSLNVYDKAGNCNSKQWSFEVEKGDSLTCSISRLADGDDVSGIYNITGTARGRRFARYTLDYYLRDDPFNRRIPTWITIASKNAQVDAVDGTLATWKTKKVNGWVKLRLRAFDLSGNVVTYGPIELQLDNSAPVVGSVVSDFVPANLSYVNSAAFDGNLTVYNVYDKRDGYFQSGSGVAASRIDMTINGMHVLPSYDGVTGTVTYVPSGVFRKTGGGFVDGVYSAALSVYDNVGNVNTKSWTFTVDNTPPSATLSYPNGDGTLGGGKPVNLTGVANDTNLLSYGLYSKLSVDDDDLFLSFSSQTGKAVTAADGGEGKLGVWVAPKIDGNYDLKLTVTDMAGNESVAYKRSLPAAVGASPTINTMASLIKPSTPILRGIVPLKGTVAAAGFGSYTINVSPVSGNPLIAPQMYTGKSMIYNGDLALWKTPKASEAFKVELKVYDSLLAEITGLPAPSSSTMNVDNIVPVVKSVYPLHKSYVNIDNLPTEFMTVAFTEASGHEHVFRLAQDGRHDRTPGLEPLR